jgi:hypothetical protein
MEPDLYLKVLNSRFCIRGDPRWVGFLAQLWEPLRRRPVTDGATEIHVSEGPGGWTFNFGEDKVFGGADPWALANNLRYLILQRVQADSAPFLVIHAAVVARNGEAVILVGASGAGKTTLALALVDRGWSLVSDDLAVLDPTSGSILSLLKPVSIKDAGAFRSFDGRWAVPEWIGAPRAGFLAPADLFSPSTHLRHHVQAVTFLERRGGGPATLSSMSGARAIASLARHVEGLDAGSVAALARLCTHAACGTLSHGRVSDAAATLQAVASHSPNWYKPS